MVVKMELLDPTQLLVLMEPHILHLVVVGTIQMVVVQVAEQVLVAHIQHLHKPAKDHLLVTDQPAVMVVQAAKEPALGAVVVEPVQQVLMPIVPLFINVMDMVALVVVVCRLV
jgi:hypothetical protein